MFKRFHQPLVIGEIVGGILLGPTVLGAFGAGATHALFPAKVRPSLDLIGQLGLILYMLIVGLDLNFKTVRSNKRMVSKISLASVLLPLALAMPLAAFLYTSHHKVGGHNVDRLAFFLFVGVSLSITAFPVLARILEDRRMHETEVGAIATACAAVQDVLGWIMLAVVLAIVSAHGGTSSLARIVGESVLCVGGIVLVSRFLGRLESTGSDGEGSGPGQLLPPAIIACALLCAAATQAIGLHAVFGAFMFGVALRRSLSASTVDQFVRRVRPLTLAFFLPVYFIGPGLHVNLRAIGSSGIAEIALILLAACAGKVIGGYASSRVSGLSSRQSAIMGSLMNTRGLIELVILQVALSAGILDGRLFSELVFMAVVTTMMTPVLLALLMRRKVGVAPEKSRAEMLALGAR
jgi:Kef-type K+ transport system membrane component KefB